MKPTKKLTEVADLVWKQNGVTKTSDSLDGFLCGANFPLSDASVKAFSEINPLPQTWEQGKMVGIKIRAEIKK